MSSGDFIGLDPLLRPLADLSHEQVGQERLNGLL
jgi:hypothetical protein